MKKCTVRFMDHTGDSELCVADRSTAEGIGTISDTLNRAFREREVDQVWGRKDGGALELVPFKQRGDQVTVNADLSLFTDIILQPAVTAG